MRMIWQAAALTLLAGCLLGCDSGAMAPTTAHGRVRFRGRPVAGARLALIPDDSRGTHGDILRAESATDGTFTLQANDPSGVPPGCYRITVMALEAPGPQSSSVFSARSVLPDRYRDPVLSELSCEIEAGQDNDIDLKLQ